jgi:predicted lipid carrier protein YhbT
MSKGSGPGRPLAARLTEADPAELASLVAETPDEELQEALRGELRHSVLDTVFDRFPEYVNPAKTRDVSAAVEWRIAGEPEDGEARYLVVVDRGECRVVEELESEPRTVITIDAVDFLQLVTGNANPTMLFFRGRIRVGGDLAFATKVAGFFEEEA